MTLDSLPDLDTSGLCLVKTLSTALTCWPFRNTALPTAPEHPRALRRSPKGRPRYHGRPAPPRQTEALSSRTSRSQRQADDDCSAFSATLVGSHHRRGSGNLDELPAIVRHFSPPSSLSSKQDSRYAPIAARDGVHGTAPVGQLARTGELGHA